MRFLALIKLNIMEIVMSTSNKGFSIALLFGVAAALSGCGESTDELDDKLTHQANMSFINSLDYMADFHVKKRSISIGYSGLFDSDNIAAGDVEANAVGSRYNYSYKVINNMINLGVKDSINANKEERINTTLSNNDDLWVIAWQSSGKRALSVIDKKQNNTADVFNVRLFANGEYDVSIDDKKVLTTKKGSVTAFLAVSNCANGLKVANQAIDLCAGNFGASYLLVVDSNGKQVMAEE